MNKQEAIQQQIDEIMDIFDFQAAVKTLEAYKSLDRGYPADWFDDGEFKEYMIRQAARECMKQAVDHGFAGHSYFSSYFHEGEDHEGPWVKIDLYFGDRTYNDGTSYEETATTTDNSN